MTKKEKETIEEKIKSDMALLKKQIIELEEKLTPITPDCGLGRLTRLEAMEEQHVNNKILDEARIRLTRLNNALHRISKPMFGFCMECEEDIGTERMLVRPESIKCTKCAN